MNGVIVLNKAWIPIDIISVFDAVTKMYRGKAMALDASFRMHNWESWVSNWKEAALLAQQVIKTPSDAIPLPRVIVLKDYKGFVRKSPKCNRRNLFIRDGKTCQYCGKKGDYSDFEIEHIMPQSRGGKTTWENVVLSCTACNQKKRNRTPDEAGMSLLRKPFKPDWHYIKSHEHDANYSLNNWTELLSDMYWTVELEE